MPKTENSVPHRCLKCQEEGSIYGRLVFFGDEPGNCPHHKTTELVPSPKPTREGSK